VGAKARGGRRRLAACMASANHDDVKSHVPPTSIVSRETAAAVLEKAFYSIFQYKNEKK
jgi:hypothetical protein